MNAYLHLDDDLADYLTEQAQQEQSVEAKLPTQTRNDSWLDEVGALREQCFIGKPGTPVEQLIAEIRS